MMLNDDEMDEMMTRQKLGLWTLTDLARVDHVPHYAQNINKQNLLTNR